MSWAPLPPVQCPRMSRGGGSQGDRILGGRNIPKDSLISPSTVVTYLNCQTNTVIEFKLDRTASYFIFNYSDSSLAFCAKQALTIRAVLVLTVGPNGNIGIQLYDYHTRSIWPHFPKYFLPQNARPSNMLEYPKD